MSQQDISAKIQSIDLIGAEGYCVKPWGLGLHLAYLPLLTRSNPCQTQPDVSTPLKLTGSVDQCLRKIYVNIQSIDLIGAEANCVKPATNISLFAPNCTQ